MSKIKSWDLKYRPTSFKDGDFVGNRVVIDRVELSLKNNTFPQTALFEGFRGTGKTTLMRLVAKSLFCSSPKNGIACEECESCQFITEHFILNGEDISNKYKIYEINMADKRGVEDALDLAEKFKAKTLFNTKQVFILDEVHRMSAEAQAVFLKVLEEPNENLYVLIGTTDKDKLLDTLVSRFREFSLKKPKTVEILNKLESIALKEGVKYSQGALKQLILKEDRILRSCIKSLEELASYGTITLDVVEEKYDIISEDIYIEFLDTLRTGKTYEIISQVNKLEELDIYPKAFIQGLGKFFVVLLNATAGVSMEEYNITKIKEFKKIMKRYSDEEIVALLKLFSEYENKSQIYSLYAMSVEANKIFNLDTEKVNINESLAKVKYTKVTEEIKDTHTETVIEKTSESDIMSIFDSAKPVDITEKGWKKTPVIKKAKKIQ